MQVKTQDWCTKQPTPPRGDGEDTCGEDTYGEDALWWTLTESPENVDGKGRLERAFDYYHEWIAGGPSNDAALSVFGYILEMPWMDNLPVDVLSEFATLFAGSERFRPEYNRVCYLIQHQLGKSEK
jgi:hypothetical protein